MLSMEGDITPEKSTEEDIPQLQEPPGQATGHQQPSTKKRKLQMNPQACLEFSTQKEGALPLTNPHEVPSSSKDPNTGMYPRPRIRTRNKQKSCDFMSAGDLMKPNASFVQNLFSQPESRGQPSNYTSEGFLQRKMRKKFSTIEKVTTNPISSYFKPKSTEISATVSKAPPETDNNVGRAVTCSQTSYEPTSPQDSQDSNGSLSDVICLDSPSKQGDSSSTLSLSQDHTLNKLFQGQEILKQKGPKKSSRKKAKKEPKFNRNNDFLYSQGTPLGAKTHTPKNSQDSGDCYGLLGTGTYSESEEQGEPSQGPMAYLPPELLENILCRLPVMDLLLNASCVCRAWYDIIMDPQFLPWKKKYSLVKKKQTEFADIVSIMQLNGMVSFPLYLKGLISYMRHFKPVTASNMTECLKKHPLYAVCEAVIREKLPECVHNDVVNPWSLMACIVVMSEKVQQISQLIQCLVSTHSQCTAMEVTECLYCIATFLYVFKLQKLQEVWTGMHYRVYYALYLYENDSSSRAADLMQSMAQYGGQQSLTIYGDPKEALRLTHEQLRICKYNVAPGDLVKIIAFAGTGKTTTLVQYTRMRPSQKFLLVVYNRSVRDHAATVFPPHVECKTGHQLAFKKCAFRYKHKLGNLRIYSVTQALPARKGMNLFVRAKFVIDTVTAFTNSADDFISTAHVPMESVHDDGKKEPIPHDQRMELVKDAELIWQKMLDPSERFINMTHDGYLKLYCLRRPRLSCDIILIDEAQDLTPAVADMLLNQRQAKILVGDPHQQIYAFRGAVNAMQTVDASHTFYLTQSFRFGPEIAAVAASLLEFLKGEKKKVLVGNGKPGGVDGTVDGQVAIITRNNFTLFTKAVEKCVYSRDCRWVAFVGGTENFGFDKLLDIYTLMMPEEERIAKQRQVQDAFYKKFPNIGELEKFAIKASDNELMGKIKIVKAYGAQLPGHISVIRSKCVSDIRRAEVVFSTAHKAKGLEFDTVYLTDDYLTQVPTIHNMAGIPIRMSDNSTDSSNVLYVAATRAKKRLLLTPTLIQLLHSAGERFIFPVDSNLLKENGVQFKCIETDQDFQPQAATLVKRKITLADGRVLAGGVYSPVMVAQCCSSLQPLIGSPQPEKDKALSGDEEAEWQAEMQEALDQDLQFMFM